MPQAATPGVSDLGYRIASSFIPGDFRDFGDVSLARWLRISRHFDPFRRSPQRQNESNSYFHKSLCSGSAILVRMGTSFFYFLISVKMGNLWGRKNGGPLEVVSSSHVSSIGNHAGRPLV
jgi:hypothetical protein